MTRTTTAARDGARSRSRRGQHAATSTPNRVEQRVRTHRAENTETTDSFQLFLNQAAHYPLLTAEEEVELAQRMGGRARAASRPAPPRRASRSRSPPPPRGAPPVPALAAASECGTVAGSAPRELAVDVRYVGSRRRASSGRLSAIRAIRPSHESVSPPSQRRGEVVRVGLELAPGRAAPPRGAAPREAAASPRAIAAADEPSPRSSGIRLRKRKRFPAGSASSA